MTHLTGPQSLVKTISLLGGPSLESTDIDWATDLPAGNAFFDWLADQLGDWSSIQNLNLEQNVTSRNAADDHSEEKMEIAMCPALRDVALDSDEVLILSHGSLSRDASDDIQDLDHLPLSRLKKQAAYINNETELLKRETDLLSPRLALSKKASRKLTQAIKSLQRTFDEVKSDTRNAEERLSELSVNADTTIATTLASAKALIHTLNIHDPDDNASTMIETEAVERSDHVQNYVHDKNAAKQRARSSLVQAQTSLTAIITDLREHTERFSFIRKEEASKNEDIQTEANRLKAIFKSMKSGPTNHILTKDPELEDVCALLEREAASRERGAAPTDLLQDFLQELNEQDDNSEVFLGPLAVDVDAEISHAICLDQIAILQMHESKLDKASDSLDVVLAPLERLHTSHAKVWHCVQEAEALLEAFGDELENIDMDFASKTFGTEDVQSKEHDHNDPANPLHEDILTEHLARKKRLAVMEMSEKAWIEALIHEYSARPIHPSLPHIYANSPLTTSAPFAFPAQVQEIVTQARDRAMRLEGLVRRLEAEVHETFTKNGPTAKRLDTFVERWCGSVPK